MLQVIYTDEFSMAFYELTHTRYKNQNQDITEDLKICYSWITLAYGL
jgi:hypothetical protein